MQIAHMDFLRNVCKQFPLRTRREKQHGEGSVNFGVRREYLTLSLIPIIDY